MNKLCFQPHCFAPEMPCNHGEHNRLNCKHWKRSVNPKVVCLCGSTRFSEAYRQAYYEETMKGHIVLSVGFYPQSIKHGENVGCTFEEKEMLDLLHLRKIEMSDEVLVLNVGGYIGDSTRREIRYAHERGKPIRYLE